MLPSPSHFSLLLKNPRIAGALPVNQTVAKPEIDFTGRRLRRIAGVHQIAANLNGVVGANCARSRLCLLYTSRCV